MGTCPKLASLTLSDAVEVDETRFCLESLSSLQVPAQPASLGAHALVPHIDLDIASFGEYSVAVIIF